MTRPGFEPGYPASEAGALTTKPPRWSTVDRTSHTYEKTYSRNEEPVRDVGVVVLRIYVFPHH